MASPKNDDDKRDKGKQMAQELEVDFEDVDEQTVQSQQVLCDSSRFSSSTKFESEGDSKDEFKKTVDVKKKGIDKSCSVEGIFGLSRSSSQYEKGEPSCTFCVTCDDAKPTGAMKRNDECGHYFCEDCIKKYVGEKIQEDVTKVECPESNCHRTLNLELCQSLFPDKDFLHYWHITFCEIKALIGPRTLRCPYPSCAGVFLDDRRDYLIIACPHCGGRICVECWVPYHMGFSCRQYQNWLRIEQFLNSAQPVFNDFFPGDQEDSDSEDSV